jgi:hypothetical protein
MLVALIGGLFLLGRILTPRCRYTSSGTYSGLVLSHDIRSRDLKLVNTNIPTLIKRAYNYLITFK